MIRIIGGGLAGSEAAWQAASRGVPVTLYEMRPVPADARSTRPIASPNSSAAIPSAATSSTTPSACSKKRCGGSVRSSCARPKRAACRPARRWPSIASGSPRSSPRPSQAHPAIDDRPRRNHRHPRVDRAESRHRRDRSADLARAVRGSRAARRRPSTCTSTTRSVRSCWPRASTGPRCSGSRGGIAA